MAFGLLVVDKPKGPTSHDLVAMVRRGTGERRVGHAGTLDPLATGVLVLALGHATRLLEYLSGSPKAYRAEITLGVETDSYDAEGAVIARHPFPSDLTLQRLQRTLDAFRGPISRFPRSTQRSRSTAGQRTPALVPGRRCSLSRAVSTLPGLM